MKKHHMEKRATIVRAPGRRRTPLSGLEPAELWGSTFDVGCRPVFFTVLGSSPRARLGFYRQFEADADRDRVSHDTTRHNQDWLDLGPLRALQGSVGRVGIPEDLLPAELAGRPTSWGLIFALGAMEDFLLEDPLRAMADTPSHVAHDLLRALWEIRFAFQERSDLAGSLALVQSVGAWLTGQPRVAPGIKRQVLSEAEQLDLLCFLLTLASQNGLIQRFFVAFDDVERASPAQLSALTELLLGASPWAWHPGMPLGLLIGWDGDQGQLRQENEPLSDLLVQGHT